MYNKKVWNTGERITADKLNNIEEGVYSNALVNKTQQVYINGLFNENKDGRLSVEGEGNELKLEGSKEGLVEVERIVGNTFVNLCTNSRNHALQKDDLKQNTMTITTSYSLTVGKQYTLVLILKDVINVNNYFLWFKAYGNDIPVTLANGVQTISFIMGDSDNSNFTLRLQLVDIQAGSKATVDSIMIFEGDLTTTPELIPTQHIEGLQSSFESNLVTQEMVTQGLESEENLGKYKLPVKIIGKNLLPYLVQGCIGSANGLFDDSSTTAVRSDYIKLDSSKEYFISGLDNRYSSFVSFYDLNKKWLGRTSGNKRSSIAIPNNLTNLNGESIGNYSYIAITQYSINIPITEFITNSSIQIEEGTVETDYEDYFERTANVYLNSPLLEGDEIVMHNGELCHYHKRKFRGDLHNLNWVYIKLYDTEDSVVFNTPDVNDYPFNTQYTNYDVISDKFISASYSVATNKHYAICLMDNLKGLRVRVPKSVLTEITPNGFKAWLQANPTTVVYELAEPYYEPIQADKLLLECANDSTLHIESIVPVESVSASYTGNVPSVYALEETNNNQDSLIDISLCATDEMYTMIEPLLSAVPQTLNNERMISKMVDMYVAMVIRGLKTIEEVPVRYREQVKEILAQLEK